MVCRDAGSHVGQRISPNLTVDAGRTAVIEILRGGAAADSDEPVNRTLDAIKLRADFFNIRIDHGIAD